MKVRIGNQEYEGIVARWAHNWQYRHTNAKVMADRADEMARISSQKSAEYFKLRYKEDTELARVYFDLLPKEIQNQLIASKKVEDL